MDNLLSYFGLIGISFPKLSWTAVRKNCLTEKKVLNSRLKTENLQKILRSLEWFIQCKYLCFIVFFFFHRIQRKIKKRASYKTFGMAWKSLGMLKRNVSNSPSLTKTFTAHMLDLLPKPNCLLVPLMVLLSPLSQGWFLATYSEVRGWACTTRRCFFATGMSKMNFILLF